ncbi:MAG: hypothetical protein QM817_06010 [Archangium sp.]
MGFLGSLFGKKKSAPAPAAAEVAKDPVPPLAAGFYRVPMVRFENESPQTLTWREVVLDGKRLLDCVGFTDRKTKKVSIGVRTGRRFETEEAARAEFETRVTQKNQWQGRRDDRPRDLPLPRWNPPPAPSINVELEARVDASSGAAFEAEARVYSDWLQSQGDPRGELAALIQAGTSPDAFLAANGEAIFGELDVLVGWAISELEWRGGLLHGATLNIRDWEGQTLAGLPELAEAFLKLPVARFVRSLRFGLSNFEGANDWGPVLQAVGRSVRGPFITSIRCDAYEYTDSEISWTNFGDLSACWAGLPALETLVIRAGADGELGELVLPSLRSLKFESGGMDVSVLDSIVRAKWPNLERLEVWTGNPGYGATVNIDQIERLLSSPLPKLKHLGIVNSELGAASLSLLVKSKLFAQLESLDLSLGILSYDNVELLLGLAPQLNKLSSINLRENLFTRDAVEKLKAALPKADLGEQRESQYRYVAVGE